MRVPPLPSKIDNLLFNKSIESSRVDERLQKPKTYELEDGVLSVTDSDDDSYIDDIYIENFEVVSNSEDAEESLETAVRKLHEKGLRGGKMPSNISTNIKA